jgi:nucleotide-binding universal stress UspA family protein
MIIGSADYNTHLDHTNPRVMKTILFPTDFSHNANRALEYAIEIAALTGATLTILHVYTPIISKDNLFSALITDEVADARREAMEKLSVITDTITKEFPTVTCRIQVKVGEIVEEIIKASEENKADLIIMGTLGANKLSKMIFGSNTSSIMEKSECPVLAVPSNCTYRPPKRILFATNFSYKDLDGVKKLALIAQAFQSEIIVGHVDISIDEENDESGSMDNFMKEVKTVTNYPNISQKIVSDHNVSMGLDIIIEESSIDLFALSTHKRNWFEKIYNPSLTKKIAHHVYIPLLAFHNPADDEKTGKDF